MIDRYTKIVLTVIAISLAGLLAGEIAPKPAKAQGELCGYSRATACWVKEA